MHPNFAFIRPVSAHFSFPFLIFFYKATSGLVFGVARHNISPQCEIFSYYFIFLITSLVYVFPVYQAMTLLLLIHLLPHILLLLVSGLEIFLDNRSSCLLTSHLTIRVFSFHDGPDRIWSLPCPPKNARGVPTRVFSIWNRTVLSWCGARASTAL